MILLDTNVVSEAMKPEPHPSVRDWLDAQAAETLFLSSVTISELLFGIGALPRSKRKDRLAAALDGVLDSPVRSHLNCDPRVFGNFRMIAAMQRRTGRSTWITVPPD